MDYRQDRELEFAKNLPAKISLMSSLKIREIIITYINNQKRSEMDYKQDRELELAKNLPAKTSLMIGRTEIPKWIGQAFEL